MLWAILGCKPKPPKSHSGESEPGNDGIEVEWRAVAVEDLMPVHVDMAPCHR
jgi:hypothetical protein